MSASAQCPHPDVHFNLNHHRSGDSNTHYVELTCKCSLCDIDMIFPCPAVGMSPAHPSASVDNKELRIPMRGEGEDPCGAQTGFSIAMSS